jgi:hypothetical protein
MMPEVNWCRKFGVTALVALAGISTLAACAGDESASSDRRPAATAARPGDATGLDVYRAADSQFYLRLVPEGAVLTRPPANLNEAVKEASAVVVAEIADIKLTRIVADTQMVGLVLRSPEVLQGSLKHGTGDVVIEFLFGRPDEASQALSGMKSSLPAGKAVWFLRWQGEPPKVQKTDRPKSTVGNPDLYNVLHLHAVFLQGQNGVVSAFREPDEPAPTEGVAASVSKHAKLSDLVRDVREIS